MIHNGELGKFNLVHACHGVVSSSPVELYVICCVTICRAEQRRYYSCFLSIFPVIL